MSQKKTLRSWIRTCRHAIEFTGFLGAIVLFSGLGLPRASKIGGKLAQWLGPWLPVHRIGMKNLMQVFPEWSMSQRRRVLEKMWFHWGAVCAEYCHLERFNSQNLEIEGYDHIAHFKDKPCIFVSGHFGNFQMISLALKECGFKVTQVYRQANNPWVNKIMQKLQRQVCHRVVAKTEHPVKAMVEALQSNESVLILIDQKFTQGPLIPLLGHLAHTTLIPARCAEKYQCALIPVYAERLEEARFKIKFFPEILPKNSPEETMRQVNTHLEVWVCNQPEQWFWIHRRWPFDYD
ncbi:lysophospholipid acyltransferase family protein [Holospora curviuscula]|uniref:lysophospholipid acyltransferase family protein n=1 Tax=Holospora curviuscula TaxID=1082868 RepID=UPI0013FD97C3|nr:hypothetical protein [Holospora curviuscula]